MGEYNISVQAYNRLSNSNLSLSQIFYVQEEIEGLRIHTLSGDTNYEKGVPCTINASVTSGTGVFYDWDFGDETTMVTTG